VARRWQRWGLRRCLGGHRERKKEGGWLGQALKKRGRGLGGGAPHGGSAGLSDVRQHLDRGSGEAARL
jgi:hypothetical protein